MNSGAAVLLVRSEI